MVADRGLGEDAVLMGTEFQFHKMKRVIKTDSGDSCTTL